MPHGHHSSRGNLHFRVYGDAEAPFYEPMHPAEGTKRTRLLRHTSGQTKETWDVLAEEAPLEIVITHQRPKTGLLVEEAFAVTMRTPGADRELALGLMLSEGLIERAESVTGIDSTEPNKLTCHLSHPPLRSLEHRQRGLYASSSCGVCGKADLTQLELPNIPKLDPLSPQIDSTVLRQLPKTLQLHQGNFENTGGLHAAALFTPDGKLISIFEDIGRHNALDKLIGGATGDIALKLSESVLLLSGRVSYELIQKAAVAKLPIIAALGAPSSLAVELAQKFGQTLIGFLREDRFNIYAHPQRILSS